MSGRASKKQPPAGLGRYPRDREQARREDNIALLRFVRKELVRQGKMPTLYDEDLTPEAERALLSINAEGMARFRATWSQWRPDPVHDAKRAADKGDIEPLRKLNPGIAGYIAPPKGKQGYPINRKLPKKRLLPPELVSLARDIKTILRDYFTPEQRRAWWSAEQMAMMIWFDKEEPPQSDDDWIESLTRQVEHGIEKRKRHISTGSTK